MKNEEDIFYVYVYLDPRKQGIFVYGNYHFYYEPFYVGKGKNGRCYDHLRYKNNSYKNNRIRKIKSVNLEPIIIKYRTDSNEHSALETEIEMIETIGRYDLKKGPLCNKTDGGEGTSGNIVSEETKRKIKNSCIGKPKSEETKQKMRKPKSEETIQKFRKPKYKPMSEEHKNKLRISSVGNTNANGKLRTEDQRKRISLSHIGLTISKETIEKRNETRRKNGWNKRDRNNMIVNVLE